LKEKQWTIKIRDQDMKIILLLACLLTFSINSIFPQRANIITEAVSAHDVESGEFTSVSSGLDVVPNEANVYLSAKNIGNDEEITSAVFEFVSTPAGSSPAFETINLTWVQFKPDLTGEYVIKLTITTAGGTDDTTKTIYVSNFVGVGNFEGVLAQYPNCMICHQNTEKFVEIFDKWKISGHANFFKRMITQGPPSYSTECMSCHTIGFNPEADNNGFDDVAAELGWAWQPPPNPDKWDTLKTQFPGLVNFATIGCENCHGPGSEHTQGANPDKIAISIRAGVCAQCHNEPPIHNEVVEWEKSVHAEAVFEVTTGFNANTNNLDDCVRCHDGQGYVNFTKGLTTDARTWTEEENASRITCATCHDPHGSSNAGQLRSRTEGSDTLANGYQYTELHALGTGATCLDCHKARKNSVTYVNTNVDRRWGPHLSTQGDVFLGSNAAEFDRPYFTSPHKFAVQDGCNGCHMTEAISDTADENWTEVSGHTWKLYNEETGYYHTEKCIDCHGPKTSWNDFTAKSDYDDDGTAESIPDEINGLLQLLRINLPPNGIDSISWEMIRDSNDINIKKAYFNYQLINNDGSKGMHNAAFAVDVLIKSIQAIGGQITSVGEPELNIPEEFSLSQNYPNPFNPSTTIKYSLPSESHVKIVIYNINGEIVKELLNSIVSAGVHTIVLDAGKTGVRLSSGVYFYSIEASESGGEKSFKEVKKMLVLK
jgi:PKD repeat protein